MSYAHGASSTQLLGETIGANLERTTARVPDHDALVSVHQNLRYTYREFNAAVDQLAKGFLAQGLVKGDRVGVWSPNYAEWALTQYATAKIGVILVNINPAYRVHELAYVLNQSGCRLLVAAPSFKTSDYRAMVAEVQPNSPNLESAIFFFSPEWDALVASGDSVPDEDLVARGATLQCDDAINIQYTSGTTGKPKGVENSHRALSNFITSMIESPGVAREDKLLAVTTLSFDIAVLELQLPLMVGARVILASREVATDGERLRDLLEKR